MTAQDQEIERTIRRLLDEVGIPVEVVVENGVVGLVGAVTSSRIRQAAIDLAASVEHVKRIEDEMNYEVVSPDMVTEPPDNDEAYGYADAQALIDDQPHEEADFAAYEGSDDLEKVVEDEETFFPPTDPVVGMRRDGGGLEVIGGFQMESTDDTDDEDEEAFEESEPIGAGDRLLLRDDEEIRDEVLRELREDAETTDLRLNVAVRRGVVVIRGKVQSLDDGDNAAAVAARIPGVVDVEDRTTTPE